MLRLGVQTTSPGPKGVMKILKPVEKQKRVYQQIIEQIRESMEKGTLKPGDKLPSERELASMMSVSRTAIREALSVMESAGLVEVLRGVGVFLKEDESSLLLNKMDSILQQRGIDLIELLEVRQGIEGQAAYLAAIRRTDSDLDNIKTAYEQMKKEYASNQVAELEDFNFHMSIVQASKNEMLGKAVKLFSDAFLDGVKQLRHKSIPSGKSEMVLQEHWDIYEAIAKQEPEKAQEAMLLHLRNAQKRYFID